MSVTLSTRHGQSQRPTMRSHLSWRRLVRKMVYDQSSNRRIVSRVRSRKRPIAVAALQSLETRLVLSAAALDPTFGGDGTVTTNFGLPGSYDEGHDIVAYQSDGKIVAVGWTDGGGPNLDFGVVRYNTDGTLDTSFGDGGRVKIDFGGTNDAGYGIAVDSQDRIVVSGYSSQASTATDFAVARLTAAGALDTSFSGDGKVTVDFGGTYDYGFDVAVDSQDRIVVAGSSGSDFAVARLTTAGVLDTSFSGDGKHTIDFGGTSDQGNSVAVDSQDRIIVAGLSNQGSTRNDFAVARLTTAGALDASFSDDGKATVDFGGTNDAGYSVAVDSEDRVLIAGSFNQGSTPGNDFAVARLTAGGVLDTSFSGDGTLTIDFGGTFDYGWGVTVDSQDRVLVAGYSDRGSTTGNDFAVARLTAGGVLDTSFSGDGKAIIDFGSTYDYGFGIAVDSQGRILVSGYSSQGSTSYDFAVARLTTDGALDTSFDDDGKTTTDLLRRTQDAAYGLVAYQSDGKLVAIGSTQGVNGDFGVVRYNTDGTLDSSFGDGGLVKIDFGGANDAGYGVAVDSQDRIVVSGYSSQASTATDFAVARLTTAGALDTSFSGDGKMTIDFGGTSDYGRGVAVDSQDRIVVAGYSSQSSTGADFAVARLTTAGALDTSFSGDGKHTVDFNSASDYSYGVAVDSQDRIVAAGYSYQGSTTGNDFAVARLTTAGALDTSFSGDGKHTIHFGSPSEVGYGAAVDSQDRILVAGYSSQSITGTDFAVARLTTAGALDTSFSGDGKQTVDFNSTSDYGRGVAVDSQDRIVVAGYSYQGSTTGNDFAVARLTTAGALDTSFSDDGKDTVDLGSTSEQAYGVAVDMQDRILISGGSYQSLTGDDFAVARFAATNQAPVAEAGGPYMVGEGASVALDASGSSDPDAGDSLTYTWDLDGDGIYGETGTDASRGDENGISPILSAADLDGPTSVIVGLRVTDTGGLTSTDTAMIIVNNVDPVLTVDAAAVTVDEGTTAINSGTWFDVPADTVTLSASLGTVILNADGSWSWSYDAIDDLVTTLVTITATDEDGGLSTITFDLTVNNVDPQNVTVLGPTAGVRGQTLSYTATFTDPGAADTHTLAWSVTKNGLAYASGTGSTFSFVPTETGSYRIAVSVTDDDGGIGSDWQDVTVTATALLADPCEPGQLALYVGGTTGADDIQISPAGPTGAVKVEINGVSQGVFTPAERIVVFGQAGDDEIQATGNVPYSLWAYGGLGNDRLKGGNADDVLLGEEGNDQLLGGSGRDLVVGGDGADRIFGNADDDILIAGSLNFDDTADALCDIMDEWTSTMSYEDRVNHLTGATSGGANGSTWLVPGTVVDDGDADLLTGAVGLDWFLFNGDEDRATDMNPLESVFSESDLDFILAE